MLDVLNATTCVAKYPPQYILALNQWLPPDIVTREKKVKSQSHGFLIGCATMQSVEIRNAIGRQVNNLGVDNQRRSEPSGFFHNARIAFGPIISIYRVETHPPVADMNLQSITVMLQLVRPARTGWRLPGDNRLTRMDESSGCV